jgi:PAS domain S-box-containing protein
LPLSIPEHPESSAAARLAALLDSAMDAIITIDEAQTIVLYNRAAERIFGFSAAQALGLSIEALIPERYRVGHGHHVRVFGATGVSSRRMSGSTVVYGRRANGEEFPVDASISQLDTPEGKLFTVIMRDVTERVQAENEQVRMAARLTGLLDSAMDAIITIDAQQRVVLYNRAAEKIFGWQPTDVLGRSMDMLLPQRWRSSHAAHVGRFGVTGVTSRRMGDGSVVHGLRRDGEEFPMDASISQLDTPEGKLFTVILRDVTDRVRAQSDLASMTLQASTVREEEKRRVARELHDELAQSLTALKMDAIRLKDQVRDDPAAAVSRLDAMLEMLDASVAATRRIAADLRPLVLDDLGLVPAVEWLVQNFTERTGVACSLEADEEMELGEPYATAVFRIVQESLANVGKHAHATQVTVALVRTEAAIVLEVRDDGVGFDPAAPRKPASLGLTGLRERAQLTSGRVDIQSRPGGGTRGRAVIPVPQEQP